ncbi:hypothetical protein IC614_03105 [Allosphingosinicella flava]|uniref:Uncharacterized protein n=1 Tax=Allosphingosinicella flava TaxID=2771430 RepID=A0A7T2GKM2_9SPHN|nr:hypothetical protein [Sphingosinicella flava]QPQ55605.1 hypothetical protein IC614_03105 [Sphingosinicella flava]
MFVARLWVTNRKLRMQEKIDDRQGFGELIQALSGEVAALRTENQALREEVRQLHGIIDGMRRGDLSAKISAQRDLIDVLPETAVSPHLKHAMNKLDEMNAGGEK